MKVVLGLGNPGAEYAATRHNVGWMVLDHLADVWRFERWRRDGDAFATTGMVHGKKVRLLKPQTFMNLSGAVLKPYTRRPFFAAAADLLVVVDEVALPIGTYRLRARGSAGGHNGLKSVQHALGGPEYARLRIGIKPLDERRDVGDLSDFVLAPFGKIERREIDELMPAIVDAIELWLSDGIDAAMNAHHTDRKPESP